MRLIYIITALNFKFIFAGNEQESSSYSSFFIKKNALSDFSHNPSSIIKICKTSKNKLNFTLPKPKNVSDISFKCFYNPIDLSYFLKMTPSNLESLKKMFLNFFYNTSNSNSCIDLQFTYFLKSFYYINNDNQDEKKEIINNLQYYFFGPHISVLPMISNTECLLKEESPILLFKMIICRHRSKFHNEIVSYYNFHPHQNFPICLEDYLYRAICISDEIDQLISYVETLSWPDFFCFFEDFCFNYIYFINHIMSIIMDLSQNPSIKENLEKDSYYYKPSFIELYRRVLLGINSDLSN